MFLSGQKNALDAIVEPKRRIKKKSKSGTTTSNRDGSVRSSLGQVPSARLVSPSVETASPRDQQGPSPRIPSEFARIHAVGSPASLGSTPINIQLQSTPMLAP